MFDPIRHLLTTLSDAQRAGRVTTNTFAADAQPPRLTIEFADADQRAAFLVSLAEITAMLPAPRVLAQAAE
jgi:hypothetical protein